jgi:hypothetical protein
MPVAGSMRIACTPPKYAFTLPFISIFQPLACNPPMVSAGIRVSRTSVEPLGKNLGALMAS